MTSVLRSPLRAPPPNRRRASRVAFYAHLWLGVIFTAALLIIAVTGIALNHKRGLGLMPDVAHETTAPFAAALSLDSLAKIAVNEVASRGPAGVVDAGDVVGSIDRMDARPRSGFVKVRMRDAASTEVTVDLSTGRVLDVGPRGDVFFEKLHSGEAFGGGWVLLSDAAAIALVITLITGYWLWLAPKLRRARDAGAAAGVATGGDA